MIPKILHYIRLGDMPYTELQLICKKSWDIHAKDWDIREWNESNIECDAPCYTHMLERGYYSHASDYLRIWLLQKYGGVYVDTDIKLLKRIDFMRKFKAVFCFMGDTFLNTALSASIPNLEILSLYLDIYDKLFQDLSVELTPTIVNTWNGPDIMRDILVSQGLKLVNKRQYLGNKVVVLPDNYVPTRYATSVAYAVHHTELSWGKLSSYSITLD